GTRGTPGTPATLGTFDLDFNAADPAGDEVKQGGADRPADDPEHPIDHGHRDGHYRPAEEKTVPIVRRHHSDEQEERDEQQPEQQVQHAQELCRLPDREALDLSHTPSTVDE